MPIHKALRSDEIVVLNIVQRDWQRIISEIGKPGCSSKPTSLKSDSPC